MARRLQDASEADAAVGSSDQAAPDLQRADAGPGTMQQLLKWRTRTKSGVSPRHISSVKKRMRQTLKRQHTDSDSLAAAESSSDSTQDTGLGTAASQAASLDLSSAQTLAQGKHTTAALPASDVAAHVEGRKAQTPRDSESNQGLTVNGTKPYSSEGAYAGLGSSPGCEPVTPNRGCTAASAALRSLPEASSSRAVAAADGRRESRPIKAPHHAPPAAALADWRCIATPSPQVYRGWGRQHTSMRCPGVRQIIRRPPRCLAPHRLQQMPFVQLRMQ